MAEFEKKLNALEQDKVDSLFGNLNGLLEEVDLSEVTEETSNDFDVIPEGYYNLEVKRAILDSNKAQTNLQVAISFQITEDGVKYDEDSEEFITNKGTKNRYINKYYPLKDSKDVKRFVSDMLKFTDEEGEPLLPRECFTDAEMIDESLEALVGSRIYSLITVSKKKDDNGVEKENNWVNLITWDRAEELGLDVE